MNLERINDEVFVAREPIVRLGGTEIAFLKRCAAESPRRRARICAHKTPEDPLHEMVIALSSTGYIHPHRHISKSESFHIIEGEVDVVVFDDDGQIAALVPLGPAGSGRGFFYRLDESAYHTLLIRTDFLVVHEVTSGPFARDRTVLAPFAPPEDPIEPARAWLAALESRVAAFARARAA